MGPVFPVQQGAYVLAAGKSLMEHLGHLWHLLGLGNTSHAFLLDQSSAHASKSHGHSKART